MRAVSNTSPLSNLAIIGRLELLREQFGTVWIPPAVAAELDRLPVVEAQVALNIARETGWLQLINLKSPVAQDLLSTLDEGEAEALTLAVQEQADLILLDESAARTTAAQLKLAHTGVLGILRHARQTGRISSLRDEISKLRRQARFFIHPLLECQLLRSVGEE